MEFIDSVAQDIEGYVEVITRNTVYGWVTVDPARFSLSILLDGLIVGVAEEFLARTDLTGKPAARGFCIQCSRPVTAADLVGGRLQVLAVSSRSIVSLPVWGPLQEAGNFLHIDLPELKRGSNSVPLAYTRNFVKELGFFKAGRGFGRISSDGLAQVGRNGHLFLVSGRNQLAKFYEGEITPDIDSWVDCFARRRDRLQSLDVRYLQVMIPEKSSVYHEYAPYVATAGSKPYLDLIGLCSDKQIPMCDVLPDLLAAKASIPVYPQGDTHLSTCGAEVVARRILASLNEAVEYTVPEITQHLRVGDLSERFSEDGDIQELVPMYRTLAFDNVDSGMELVSSFDPESGHQGRRRVWRNDAAPVKKKVVCFGNSFFERGENSGYLSWWFARMFSEFHFVWSSDLELDYVRTVSPDIVICQSIERFLTEVPAA